MGELKMTEPYFESLKRNIYGGIDGVYFNGQFPDGVPYTLDPAMGHIVKAEAGEWGPIEDLSQSEKDAYAAQQATDLIKQELAALDVPLHTLALAISGDAKALGKVGAAEAEKEVLRAKL